MSATEFRIQEATEKFNEWVEYFATRPEADLVKRIRINHAQYKIAQENKDYEGCELLNIMERILIEARIYKDEHNIPDVPSEIEQALAESELMEKKIEERKAILQPKADKELISKVEVIREQEHSYNKDTEKNANSDEQLSLF